MVRQKQNEEKKGFDELNRIMTPAFNNAYFIEYFKNCMNEITADKRWKTIEDNLYTG